MSLRVADPRARVGCRQTRRCERSAEQSAVGWQMSEATSGRVKDVPRVAGSGSRSLAHLLPRGLSSVASPGCSFGASCSGDSPSSALSAEDPISASAALLPCWHRSVPSDARSCATTGDDGAGIDFWRRSADGGDGPAAGSARGSDVVRASAAASSAAGAERYASACAFAAAAIASAHSAQPAPAGSALPSSLLPLSRALSAETRRSGTGAAMRCCPHGVPRRNRGSAAREANAEVTWLPKGQMPRHSADARSHAAPHADTASGRTCSRHDTHQRNRGPAEKSPRPVSALRPAFILLSPTPQPQSAPRAAPPRHPHLAARRWRPRGPAACGPRPSRWRRMRRAPPPARP